MRFLRIKLSFFLLFVLTVFSYSAYNKIQEPEMILVDGGTFIMGCTAEQGEKCFNNEKPEHQVTVSSFKISKYPITQGQWNAVMGTTLRQQRKKAGARLNLNQRGFNVMPMYFVSWDEAQEFCKKLSELTGKNYRLPTEAEWEFAARGGIKSNGYRNYNGPKRENIVWWVV